MTPDMYMTYTVLYDIYVLYILLLILSKKNTDCLNISTFRNINYVLSLLVKNKSSSAVKLWHATGGNQAI